MNTSFDVCHLIAFDAIVLVPNVMSNASFQCLVTKVEESSLLKIPGTFFFRYSRK